MSGIHFSGVAFVVEEDELLDPVEVSLFGADAEVFESHHFADLVHEFCAL